MATGRLAARLGRATEDPADASRPARSPSRARIGIDARKLRDGGIGRYLHELLGRLPRLAPHLDLIALARPEDEDTLRQRFPTVRVAPVRSGGYSLSEHLELAWVASRERLDLLHAPHYVFPRGIRCPVVVTVHDLVHWRLPRSRLHALYCRRMLAAVRRRARVVLTPSESVAGDLVSIAGFDRRRIVVAPNGLSASFESAPDEPARVALQGRLGVSEPYVLSVTNGLPHKGLDVLLAAAAPLSRLSLVLAGAGSDRPAVLRQVRSAGVPASRLAILGEVPEEELRLLYRAARVVAVPSLLEGFGLPALEAMASGTPVVASDAGALPEVVGDAGILVPAGSVAELRVALYRIAFEIDPMERASLVQRGLERSRLFSWERTARETLAAYEQGLGG